MLQSVCWPWHLQLRPSNTEIRLLLSVCEPYLTEGDLTDFLSTSTPCWPCRQAVNFLCVLWETCLTSSRRFSTWWEEKDTRRQPSAVARCAHVLCHRFQLSQMHTSCNTHEHSHSWSLFVRIMNTGLKAVCMRGLCLEIHHSKVLLSSGCRSLVA